jgi:DNA sulfur modification protein DndE
MPLPKPLILLCLLLLGALTPVRAQTPPPIRLTLLGDSMMSDQPPERPIQGWGTYLEEKLKNAKVLNLGWSGASTKTFIQGDVYSDGRPYPPFKWQKAQATPADYWLISFGGNDANKPGHYKHTDPSGDYAANLSFFISEARKRGIKPILLTPIHPKFENGKLPDRLQPYADSMKQVAEKEKTPLIDLYAFTTKWYSDLGPEKIQEFVPLELGGHYNKAGAETMAAEVAAEFSKIEPLVKKDTNQ